MPDKTKWAALVAGAGCPMDAPRPASNDHWDLVGQLSVSSLYLAKNQTYRGQCQLIFDARHVARVDQLSLPEWTSLAADLFTAQQAVTRVVAPDHVNVESLGNVVPHLHWHIIPRYVGDPMWGAPIWRVPLDSMPDTRLQDEERAALLTQLRKALAGPVTDMTGVGLSARWVAANRALETDHASPLYRDPYARDLAGEAGFEVLYSMRTASGMGSFSGPDPYLTVRTRFFDDALLGAVRESSIDQVVILAAGMDARAFRLEWPAGVRLFEVDREDVFKHKQAVLTRLQAKAPCDRRVVQEYDYRSTHIRLSRTFCVTSRSNCSRSAPRYRPRIKATPSEKRPEYINPSAGRSRRHLSRSGSLPPDCDSQVCASSSDWAS
jgi:diadenosine tetraphosphate (Ap4A) HIT family hydrolase